MATTLGPDGGDDLDFHLGVEGLADEIEFAAAYAKPKEVIPFREWGPRNIVVPKAVNPERSGPLSWDGFEYAPEMMDRLMDPSTRVGVICAPPQFLKTFLSTVGMLYVADQLGGTQMYATTTRPKRNEFCQQKLEPLIENSPRIERKIPKDGRGGYDTEYYNHGRVHLGGEDLFLGWAGSAASLASTTAMWFWGDEPAKWKGDFKQEGGAVGLAKKRVEAFPDTSHVIMFSTPPQVVEEENAFWEEFMCGTIERPWVPCPSCGQFAPLAINKHWGEDESILCFSLQHRAKKDKKGHYDLAEVEATTTAVCPHCKEDDITDRHKPEMVRRYEWRPGNLNPDPGQVSFWINRLYQPGRRFGSMLSSWFKANRTERQLMEFLLSEMAQPYRPPKNKVEVGRFRHLLVPEDEDYPLGGPLPKNAGAISIVVHADVQEIEIPWTAWAVTDQKVWLLNYGDAFELKELNDVAEEHVKRCGIPFKGGIIDAGHRTREVYAFCADNEKFIPAHGRDMQKLFTWSKDLDVEQGMKRKNRRHPRLVKAILWQNFSWKNELYIDILRLFPRGEFQGEGAVTDTPEPEHEPSVQMRFPRGIVRHPKFLRQLSGERLEHPKGKRAFWKAFRANHYGDTTCELLVYLELFRGRLSAPKRISANQLASTGGKL